MFESTNNSQGTKSSQSRPGKLMEDIGPFFIFVHNFANITVLNYPCTCIVSGQFSSYFNHVRLAGKQS